MPIRATYGTEIHDPGKIAITAAVIEPIFIKDEYPKQSYTTQEIFDECANRAEIWTMQSTHVRDERTVFPSGVYVRNVKYICGGS